MTRREAWAILVLLLLVVGALAVRPLVEQKRGLFPDPHLEAAIRMAVGKPEPEPLYAVDCRSLTSLNATFGAGGGRISDLTGIENCIMLTRLELGFNNIKDISPLASLTQLTWLDLSRNQIRDISPLSSLVKLTRLRLNSNRIEDASPLSSLTSLMDLDLGGNPVRDISALVANEGLGKGDTLHLDNTRLLRSPGSKAMQDIAALKARGVVVQY